MMSEDDHHHPVREFNRIPGGHPRGGPLGRKIQQRTANESETPLQAELNFTLIVRKGRSNGRSSN